MTAISTARPARSLPPEEAVPNRGPAIVVGISPGRRAAAALRYAAARSARSGLPLRLVTAFAADQTGDQTGDDEIGGRARRIRTAVEAARCQERALTRLRTQPNVQREQLIARGAAAEVLTRAVRPGDLLVIGTSRSDGVLGRAVRSRGGRGPMIIVAPPPPPDRTPDRARERPSQTRCPVRPRGATGRLNGIDR